MSDLELLNYIEGVIEIKEVMRRLKATHTTTITQRFHDEARWTLSLQRYNQSLSCGKP